MLRILQNDEEFDMQLAEHAKVVLDFSGSFCRPCKQIEPYLKELANQNPGIQFLKVDVNHVPRLVEEFRVTTIPALKFFQNGKELTDLAVYGANMMAIKNSVQRLQQQQQQQRYPHEP